MKLTELKLATAVALFLPIATSPALAQSDDADTGMNGTAEGSATEDPTRDVPGEAASDLDANDPTGHTAEDMDAEAAQGEDPTRDVPGEAASDMADGDGTGQMASDGATDGTSGQTTAQSGTMGPDALVVTVDDAEITAGEVMAIISALPSQMQQQPRETLVPFAVQQLIMRELVLQEVMAEGLESDPEVQELMGGDTGLAQEDAVVRVWLEREMEGAVSDEAVQTAYDEIKAQSETEIPPLEDVRAQITKQLRRQEMNRITGELAQDVDIVFYGPDGKPRNADTAPEEESGDTTTGEMEDTAGQGTDATPADDTDKTTAIENDATSKHEIGNTSAQEAGDTSDEEDASAVKNADTSSEGGSSSGDDSSIEEETSADEG